MRRFVEFDEIKGIAICAVMLSHVVFCGGQLSKFLFAFHIPCFFLVSGVLFSPERVENGRDLLRKMLCNFLLPYLFFNAIGGLLWWPFNPKPFPSFGDVFLSMVWYWHPKLNGPTWFLPVLAVVQCAFWFGYRRCRQDLAGQRNKTLKMLSFVVAAVLLGSLISCIPCAWLERMPFKVGALVMGGAYFSAGGFFKGKFRGFFLKRKNRFYDVVVLCIAVCGVCLMTPLMRWGHIAVPKIRSIWFFPVSALGIVAVFYFVRVCGTVLLRPFAFIGRNSLYYFAMDLIVQPIVCFALRDWIDFSSHSSVLYMNLGMNSVIVILAVELLVVTCLAIVVRPVLRYLQVNCARFI